jgi:hypothetical protein
MSGVFLGNTVGVSVITATINPANIATATTTEEAFTVPGLLVGDFVYAVKPTVTAGIAVASSRVSAANTLAITFVTTTTNINAPSESYQILVIRPEAGASTNIQQ